jgi:hypothetical protein
MHVDGHVVSEDKVIDEEESKYTKRHKKSDGTRIYVWCLVGTGSIPPGWPRHAMNCAGWNCWGAWNPTIVH